MLPDSKLAPPEQRDARRWLLLGVLALALAGVYSVPLFIGRTPLVKASALLQRLFDATLVVHVDLSILVWFLAVVAMTWRLYCPATPWLRLPYFQIAAQAMFASGIALLALAPWLGGDHIKSDYIPVIGNGAFFGGLALIAAAIAVAMVEALLAWNPFNVTRRAFTCESSAWDVVAFGAWGMALTMLAAFVSFALSAERVSPLLVGREYYETVFWAGGHLLQFVYVQAMMIAWLTIVALSGMSLMARKWPYALLLAFTPIAALSALSIFRLGPIDSDAFRTAFTRLMIEANGAAPALLGIALVVARLRGWRPSTRGAPWIALWASALLFAVGGFIGHAIDGQNVTVPAHYHGSIVGVTIAFMGYAYAVLPYLGLPDPASWRMARWQPVILCVGQMIFAFSLAWSGGYEVMRKTVGLEGYPPKVKLAMALVGTGGAMAVGGGILFVIVVWRAWRMKDSACEASGTPLHSGTIPQ